MVLTVTHDPETGVGYKITRRTFDACEHPPGSAERARFNERAETSEYMPSYRYTLRGPHLCTSYRTKREADAALARLVDERGHERKPEQ